MAIWRVLGAALILTSGLATGCGGGPTLKRLDPASSTAVDVFVSAGGPVSGATVTIYAIGDETGEVDTSFGDQGVLGSGGPTDATGHAAVTPSAAAYSGPVQVAASGTAMMYPDPTVPVAQGQPAAAVQVPASFVLSSFLPSFTIGDAGVAVPLTYWTTLADHEAIACVKGLLHGRAIKTLTQALAPRDGLFVAHITNSADNWAPTALRTTIPAPIASTPTTLIDTAFAAIFDVAVNQLARDTAARAGYGGDSGAFTAPALMQLLEEDLDADGQFDGKGLGGRTLTTLGATPVTLDSQFLRIPLAESLDNWIRDTSVNHSGIRQADLIGSQVYTSITLDASDLFGSLPAGPFDPTNHTPPVLALATTPPKYTNATSVTLSVSATDPSGVAGVYALVGGQQTSATQQANGTWQLVVSLPTVGHNLIQIWGVDDVQPTPNSGFGGPPPSQLMVDVVYDATAPAISYDGTFASYFDERVLSVNVDENGMAVVPPVYSFGPRYALAPGGEIYKAATRLSMGTSPVAQELETANAANIPVLRFYAPVDANTEAPIVTATFNVLVSCPAPCPTFPDATGALLVSPQTDGQTAFFDLPLAVETVPALANVLGPATLAVTITLVDAAGNTGTANGFTFTFHLLGAPLAITEDIAYPAAEHTDSTYAYHLADDTYATMWSSLGDPQLFPSNLVRLKRFVISNPAPVVVPVAVAYGQDGGGSWRAVETWVRFDVREPGSEVLNTPNLATAFTLDGFIYEQPTFWSLSGTPGTNVETAPYPCSSLTAGDPVHKMGDNVTKYTCSANQPFDPILPGSEAVTSSVSDVGTAVYRVATELGGEELAPDTDPSGSWFLVPAASGSTPGVLVLYLTRPLAATRSMPLTWNLAAAAPMVVPAVNHYQTWDYEYFFWFGVQDPPYVTYMPFRAGAYLSAAADQLWGTLGLTTDGYTGSALVGEAAGRGTVAFSGDAFATH